MVNSFQKLSDSSGGFAGTLRDGDFFGSAIAGIGDLDADGIEDIAGHDVEHHIVTEDPPIYSKAH